VIQIIISIDPSTQFLFEIIDKLKSYQIELNVTELHPTEESYSKSYENVSKFEKNSVILFLGHGTDEKLYGGELLPDFKKKEFIKLTQMNVFANKNLFALSCNSAGLIKKSYKLAKLNKSIGFGGLPTSKDEIEDDKKLREQGVSESTIEDFKSEIVNIASMALVLHHNDFNKLSDYITLLLDQRINNAVLVKKDRNLADLLFKMRSEMVFY
jgi:hypothetical protein